MIERIYKKVLLKLDLDKEQLLLLRNSLVQEKVCVGPFTKDGKTCPNTTALAIKIGDLPNSSKGIRELFNAHGISNIQLWFFYLIWDIPALISKRYYERSLNTMRNVVDSLINTSSNILYQTERA